MTIVPYLSPIGYFGSAWKLRWRSRPSRPL